MSVFSAPVFDATVVFEGQELFKGRGAAQTWAEKVAKEVEAEVTVEKIGTLRHPVVAVVQQPDSADSKQCQPGRCADRRSGGARHGRVRRIRWALE